VLYIVKPRSNALKSEIEKHQKQPKIGKIVVYAVLGFLVVFLIGVGIYFSSNQNQIKLTISIPILRVLDLFGSFSLGRIFWKKSKTSQIRGRLELYSFIEKTWSIRNLADVLTLVSYLKNMQKFQALQIRFSFWEKAIRDLQDKT
jgi:hypothetical protein